MSCTVPYHICFMIFIDLIWIELIYIPIPNHCTYKWGKNYKIKIHPCKPSSFNTDREKYLRIFFYFCAWASVLNWCHLLCTKQFALTPHILYLPCLNSANFCWDCNLLRFSAPSSTNQVLSFFCYYFLSLLLRFVYELLLPMPYNEKPIWNSAIILCSLNLSDKVLTVFLFTSIIQIKFF